MRYWWVNQNQTYRAEVRGNFMWSPKTNAKGGGNPFYDFMREAQPGDLVFSSPTRVLRRWGSSPVQRKPLQSQTSGVQGANWCAGRVVYSRLLLRAGIDQIRPKDHIEILSAIPSARFFATSNDRRRPAGYLPDFEFPGPLADALIGLMGSRYFQALPTITGFPECAGS